MGLQKFFVSIGQLLQKDLDHDIIFILKKIIIYTLDPVPPGNFNILDTQKKLKDWQNQASFIGDKSDSYTQICGFCSWINNLCRLMSSFMLSELMNLCPQISECTLESAGIEVGCQCKLHGGGVCQRSAAPAYLHCFVPASF